MPEPTPPPEPRETRVKPTWKTWAIVGIWAFYPEIAAGIIDTIWALTGGYLATITHHTRVVILYYPRAFSSPVGVFVGMLSAHFFSTYRGSDPQAVAWYLLSFVVGWALMHQWPLFG